MQFSYTPNDAPENSVKGLSGPQENMGLWLLVILSHCILQAWILWQFKLNKEPFSDSNPVG